MVRKNPGYFVNQQRNILLYLYVNRNFVTHTRNDYILNTGLCDKSMERHMNYCKTKSLISHIS